ncbi:MAG: arginase family protein [Patescibacteria group bacterium]
MYNPNTGCVDNSNFAAIEGSFLTSDIVIFPVPWEATVSYREGTQNAPELIRTTSLQLDLFDKKYEFIDVNGRIYWDRSIASKISDLALKTRTLVQAKLINDCDKNYTESTGLQRQILNNCELFNSIVYSHSKQAIEKRKIVGLVGGDHSTPLGQIKAIGEMHSEFGILHLDAHHDLRPFFQGMKYSHGSIFHNVLEEVSTLSSLVQVGIRDYCDKEYYFAKSHPKVNTFYDDDISEKMFGGIQNWGGIVDNMIDLLPQNVYVSLDMDGLTIENTLSTGTPVPGGLSFAQVRYLFNQLSSRRTVVGFDVVECGPSEVDAIVAMRLLFQLCNVSLNSQKNVKF